MWRKSWILLFGVIICGCSTQVDDSDKLRECLDSPDGEIYYVGQNELCCHGSGVAENDTNCGSCGNACINGNHCVSGTCICESTGDLCSLTCTPVGCVDPMTNPSYCGADGKVCNTNAGEWCNNGSCITSCPGELDQCGTQCVDLENDAEHCGRCDNACPGDSSTHVMRSYCLNKQCYQVCDTGYTDKDGSLENGCEEQTNNNCGNGLLDAGEECDGANFGRETCESLVGQGSHGKLLCRGCMISVEHCSSASTCGNNMIDGHDVCDGAAINNATCESILGSGSTGRPGCRENCTAYDVSGCTAPAQCGNGFIEAKEVCDGPRLNDQTCASVLGLGWRGTLRCNSTCTDFDTTGCSYSTCGNGILEAGEVCDTSNVKGATCESEVGHGSKGMVLCGNDCKYLNLSGCSAATQCGNGQLDLGEVCEVNNLNGASCESVVGKGSTGTLKCGDGCKHFDFTGCSKSAYCGDSSIQAPELCDGPNLAGKTCADVKGFGSKGSLKCLDNCMGFDTDLCTSEITCGNGKLDPGEVCDGDMLNGANCAVLKGYGSTGTPKCNDTCSGVTTDTCSEPIKCGNSKLDAGEVCDGYNLNGQTCAKLVGYGSTGTPECNDTCTGYTNGSCTPEIKCGNSKIDSGEDCDGTLLNNSTCASVVGQGSTGNLYCNASTCKFITDGCSTPTKCNNGELDDGEECDKTKFTGGITNCKTYDSTLYSAGKLKCSDNCRIDTSECTKYCGNGVVDANEVCDKTNLNQKTCANQVGEGSTGTLLCSSDCKSFDTSGCSVAAYCGDGKINRAVETCDTNTFNTPSNSDECSKYSDTYASGKIRCNDDCTVDISNCVKKPYCGDQKVNNNEDCDGSSFKDNKTTCAEWDSKYTSGNVSCFNNNCTINYKDCVEPTSLCKNGELDTGEFCDTNKFVDDLTCVTWGGGIFSGGTLKCTDDCQIDDSECIPAPRCGDKLVNQDTEDCDGNNFRDNKTACTDWSSSAYQSGTVGCYEKTCKINYSNCVPVSTATCGDHHVNQSTEECDGSEVMENHFNCSDWSSTYASGTVGCNQATCEVTFDNCIEHRCGDNILSVSEPCDGNLFISGFDTCTSIDSNMIGGSLTCTSDCNVSTNNCVSSEALTWAAFYHLDTSTHMGYGRILLPNGVNIDDLVAYMACTNDLSKPVKQWNVIEAVHNAGCTNCNSNTEFMTTLPYAGEAGTNYCTFVFEFNGSNNIFATHPVQNGPAEPIRLYDTTVLNSGTPRTFTPDYCYDADFARCNGSELQWCDDHQWIHMEYCKSADKCNPTTGECMN